MQSKYDITDYEQVLRLMREKEAEEDLKNNIIGKVRQRIKPGFRRRYSLDSNENANHNDSTRITRSSFKMNDSKQLVQTRQGLRTENISPRHQVSPVNKEKQNRILIYNKMAQEYDAYPNRKIIHYRQKLEARSTKLECQQRGYFLQNEIEVSSKPVLSVINKTLQNLQLNQSKENHQKKLTSLQVNKIVLKALDIDQNPRKYLYYERFKKNPITKYGSNDEEYDGYVIQQRKDNNSQTKILKLSEKKKLQRNLLKKKKRKEQDELLQMSKSLELSTEYDYEGQEISKNKIFDQYLEPQLDINKTFHSTLRNSTQQPLNNSIEEKKNQLIGNFTQRDPQVRDFSRKPKTSFKLDSHRDSMIGSKYGIQPTSFSLYPFGAQLDLDQIKERKRKELLSRIGHPGKYYKIAFQQIEEKVLQELKHHRPQTFETGFRQPRSISTVKQQRSKFIEPRISNPQKNQTSTREELKQPNYKDLLANLTEQQSFLEDVKQKERYKVDLEIQSINLNQAFAKVDENSYTHKLTKFMVRKSSKKITSNERAQPIRNDF
ncbi:UNKNOWN [Stylonychia lemnae]|uniref:Uncharacterized protein n=1 Tax=Stylonychia lemnae TaxID=5949 RepID=A0A078A1W2_STYLE|nr:UNKNOWN [Stylonychia lemnae]|eukprot:CDW75812.1 UNKNOWN [Stylonychia lemnae]